MTLILIRQEGAHFLRSSELENTIHLQVFLFHAPYMAITLPSLYNPVTTNLPPELSL